MQHEQWDKLLINGNLLRCIGGYDLLSDAAIAIKDEKIAWLGDLSELESPPENIAKEIIDLEGAYVTPGLIDCHTHVVYGGDRVTEFEARLKGATYEEIALSGGGIQSTVTATRAASHEQLLADSARRVLHLMQSGVTTLEVKSGYGLDWDTEEKMLLVAEQISQLLPVDVYPTFLAAHTVPKEYQGKADEYVRLICEEMIPKVAELELAHAVDVFCEKIAFNLEQAKLIFDAAEQHGLAIKCHAEQLSDSGAAALAARYFALSVDHLEYLSDEGIEAIEEAGTVAVLLPGAYYFLSETKKPPVDQLRQKNIPMAIATDCNPGSSPAMSILLMMSMACQYFKLTPEEALIGVTHHAARAMGLADTHGSLEVNKIADLAVWDIQHPAELAYYFGSSPLRALYKHGEQVEL